MFKLNKNAGFTLIELLVVISIIAILSTVVMLNYSSIQKKSRGNQAKTDIANMTTELETYKASHSNVIVNTDVLGSHTSGNDDWISLWTAVNGCTGSATANNCPTPPSGSGITYTANISSNDYYLCASGEDMANVLSSDMTNWVGHNGNFYEFSSCPDITPTP